MTNAENLRLAGLSKMYMDSLSDYDGHSMYRGLPRYLAQEYDNLRAKRDAEKIQTEQNEQLSEQQPRR